MNSLDARVVKNLPAVKDTAAFQLDVHFYAGQGITVIIGPSGSGKTLFLNCLAGFVRPDRGRILLHGELYFDAATSVHLLPEKRRCGYIFQDHALFPHMSVRENLQFAARLQPSRSSLNVRRRVNDLLEAFDLTDLGNRRPAQLSGGQRQRAALARILVGEPRALLLDEPLRGLDLHLRQAFYALLRSVRERLSIPILLVSHHAEECFELADTVAVFENGRVLQEGGSAEVFTKPVTMEVARLLGVFNIAPAQIKALDPGRDLSRVLVLGQEIEGPYFPGHLIGDNGFLCMRRSECRLAPDTAQASNGHLTLRVAGAHPSPYGIRVALENDQSIILSQSEYSTVAGKDRFTLEVPPAAIAFTAQ